MRKGIQFILVFAALGAAGNAQQGQVAGPVAGYVFDGTAHTVRPVLGIPGASVLGSSVALGYNVTSATISPKADSVLATAADGSLHLVALSSGQPTEVPLNGASANPSRVVFSPSGTAVALIGAGRAQVFNGLPSSPTLAGTMDLGNAGTSQVQAAAMQRGAPASPASMALTDDGSWLLAVSNGSAQLIGAGGSHTIGSAGRGSLVAFAPGTHDAAILNARQSLTLVRNADSAATQQALVEGAGVTGATGVAFSADGKSLYLAGAGQAVTVFDLAGGTQTPVTCNCTATGLTRMGNVFRLNELGSGPLWLLDPTGSAPRIVFVPASTASE